MYRHRSWLPVLVLIVVAAACSSTDDAAETTVAETTVAATTAADTTVAATTTTSAATTTTPATTTTTPPTTTTTTAADEAPGEPVTFPTADGLTLEGRRFGSGSSWVVLAHMRPASMDSWFEFAEVLAAEGYSALAFNFRGYGDSEGSGLDVDTDVLAAIDFADGLGAEDISVIGASMGGTGAVTASSQRPVVGTITLSAPSNFEGADAAAAAPALTAPILLVAAEDEFPYPAEAAQIAAGATVPSEVVLLTGSNHGTDMFIDHGPELTALILEFLAGPG